MNITEGTKLKIFQDPITCKMYEGRAIVKRILSVETIDCEVDVEVVFEGDEADAVVRRKICFESGISDNG